MRILLDTNAYSAFKLGSSRASALVSGASEIVFSPVVAGELLAGFRWGTQFERNRIELEAFLAHPRVRTLALSTTTADRYGRLYRALRTKGTPIPTNDMWIAAQAMETGTELVSADRHFALIEGLAWVDLGQTLS